MSQVIAYRCDRRDEEVVKRVARGQPARVEEDFLEVFLIK